MLRILACTLFSLLTHAQDDARDWPQWRGARGDGVAQGAAPLHWNDEQGIRWKTRVPGRGTSTPIVLGDRIFLSTAVESNKKPAGEEDEPPRRADGTLDEGFTRGRMEGRFGHQLFAVLCYDRTNGELLWHKVVRKDWPHQGHHKQYGSYASRAIVTDGEHLFASFGSWGIYCLDLDGNLVWEVDPGVELDMRHGHGEGAAPVLHGDTLVHVFDHEGDSFIAAWDKNTGEELWRTARDEPSSWSQPIVVQHGDELQVVASGENAIRAYDLATGEESWRRSGLGRAVIVTPVQHGDNVIAMTGHLNPVVMAVRLGGKGELPDEDIVWSSVRGAAYTPSPLLHGDDLYVATDRGQISCFDANTGELHYREQRLPRGTSLKSSPVAADGRIYIAAENGAVHVLALDPRGVELLRTNLLTDQVFIASPVIVGGELLLRSMDHLFCIDGYTPE